MAKALQKFQHPTPRRYQYVPHWWKHPNLGATKQLANTLYNSLLIPEEQNRRIKQIGETFLYYTCAVKCTMMPALNSISDQQAHPTKNTKAEINHIMDYAATNPDAVIKF